MPPSDAPAKDPSAQTIPNSDLTVLIKSPTDAPGTPPFNLTVSRTASVRDAKAALELQYPSHPPASSQRLIHAGKLLADSTPLIEALTGDPPQVIHLVAASRSPVQRFTTPSPPTMAQTPPSQNAAPEGGASPAEGYAAHLQEVEAAFARLLHHHERYIAIARTQPPEASEAAAAEIAQYSAAIADYDASTRRQRDAIRGVAGAPGPAMAPQAPHPIVFPPMGGFQGPPGFQPLPGFHAMMYQAGVPVAAGARDAPGAPPAPAGPFPPGAAPNGAFPPGAVPFGAPPGQQGPVWRRQFVFQFDFHWALLAKLAFFVFLLAQEGSPRRTKMLFALAAFIYLWQTGHLGFLRRLLAIVLPSPNQLFVNMSALASAADGDPQREARVVPRNIFIRKTAVLFSYLYSFFYGFFCSLLPSWNPEPLPPLFHLFTLPPNNVEGERDAQEGGGAADDHAMPPPDANWRPHDAPREAGHPHAE